jgi:hypothetical protein
MTPGSVFFDKDFQFHDGESGEKLFVALGSANGVSVVVKTTSQPHGRGIDYGYQVADRFPNFYLPVNTCYLKKNTWVCLDEFFELRHSDLLQKRFSSIVNHICDLSDNITREIQVCAMQSDDITPRQEKIIQQNLIPEEH